MIYYGDSLEVLQTLPSESVHCCITSPPYWGLRDYGTDGQLGLESTPEEYTEKIVEIFREVKRVLRNDGTLWLNLGDTYNSNEAGRSTNLNSNRTIPEYFDKGKRLKGTGKRKTTNLKPKDLCGIPWRVAFALQADGWYLRSDVIWCLSGGTWLYAQTQKGEMPMTVRNIARLDPATVKLWNGAKWTQLLGINKSGRTGSDLQFTLRSGERISCTPEHKFPTERGLLKATDIRIGDIIKICNLPEPETPRDCALDIDAAWFAGLFIAEGSRSEDTIQISGHRRETERWQRIQQIAHKYGGSATITIDGNNQSIRVYGKILNAIIDELVTGKIAKNKGFAPVVWRYSNEFLESMLDGYLSGDGFWDAPNKRWRLGFTRNYNLERDLRTTCARLGYRLTLKLAQASYNGQTIPVFKGEIRKQRSGHGNERVISEVIDIQRARFKNAYDLGVEDDPHLFSLASGVLTHNSKPNPMPESCTDRPTKAHEYLFLLSKRSRYFYDADAIREEHTAKNLQNHFALNKERQGRQFKKQGLHDYLNPNGRNKRSVWEIPTKPYSGAHFATFPSKLVEPCILAGTSPKACPHCAAPWERVTETIGKQPCGNPHGDKATIIPDRLDLNVPVLMKNSKTQKGWRPTCECPDNDGSGRCVVLDPFIGSGTVAEVAVKTCRDYIGIELNRENEKLIRQRVGLYYVEAHT